MEGNDIPVWAALLTALFVLAGATLTLIGCLGLLRLDSFYRRIHAPTLGSTLGTGGVLIGSMIFFTVLGARPVLHEIRSEEHTSELQSLMRISYAVFCLK